MLYMILLFVLFKILILLMLGKFFRLFFLGVDEYIFFFNCDKKVCDGFWYFEVYMVYIEWEYGNRSGL